MHYALSVNGEIRDLPNGMMSPKNVDPSDFGVSGGVPFVMGILSMELLILSRSPFVLKE